MHLEELHVVFNEQMDEAYKANFNVIALNKTYSSQNTKPKLAKINHEQNRTLIDWVYNITHHIAPNYFIN